MKNKNCVKNSYSKMLSYKKHYNPNGFDAFDSAISYIAVLIVFEILSLFLTPLLSNLWKKEIIKDYFLLSTISLIFSQFGIFLTAFVFYKIRKVDFFSGEGFTYKLNTVTVLMSVMLIIGVLLCFTPLHLSFSDDMYSIFNLEEIVIPEEILKNSDSLIILLYAFIFVPVTPAIVEELLFRGIIMRGMKGYGSVFAVIGSSLLFALMHGNLNQIILQFIGGVAISTIVLLTKNHIYGCIMHFANNIFAVVVSLLSEVPEETLLGASYLVDAFEIILGIVFLLTAGLYFIKMYTTQYKNEILGKKKVYNKFEKMPTICYTVNVQEDLNCLGEFTENIEFDDVQSIEQFNSNEKAYMLYGKTFVKTKKRKSNKNLWALFLIISFVLAIFSLIINVFYTKMIYELIFIVVASIITLTAIFINIKEEKENI